MFKNWLAFLFILFFLSSCGKSNLEKMGLIKKQQDEYSFTKKNALVMPPDMLLRPPGTEKKQDLNVRETNIIDENSGEELSLDEILTGSNLKKKKVKKKYRQISKSEKSLINDILNAKASAELK